MAIFTGETVEEAIERGLARLNVNRENVHIHVEQKEKRGFFGIGRKRAKVNIEPIQEDTVRQANVLAERGVSDVNLGVPKAKSAMEATLELSQVVKAVRAAEAEHNGEITTEEREKLIEEAKSAIIDNPTEETISEQIVEEDVVKSDEESKVITKISSYLTSMTQEMGIATKVKIEAQENLTVFNLSSVQDALLIGKHGKILQALETLAKAYANSISEQRMNLAVNVGDYHEKRKNYIVALAKRAAERARDGETVYINDLQSGERKIIHTIIAQENGVRSHSDGNENKRYIVVTKEI